MQTLIGLTTSHFLLLSPFELCGLIFFIGPSLFEEGRLMGDTYTCYRPLWAGDKVAIARGANVPLKQGV